MKTKKTFFLFIFFISFIGLISFSPKVEIEKPKPNKLKAKYVFLFIGDGMGMAHIYITNEYLKLHKQPQLSFINFPYYAFTTTFCADSMRITDSAAAGTAIATGSKTNSGVLGMLPKTGEKFTSIAEIAKQNGFKVGILSSVGMNHATPAAFYAKQPKRSMYKEIAEDMARSNFDLFAGGGLYAKDKNELNYLFNNLKTNGYRIFFNEITFNKELDSDKKLFYTANADTIPGFAIPYRIDQKESDVTLSEYVDFGIQFLENETGFFMMAEGGKIDWAAHDNDGATTVKEVIDFDLAVKKALDFYQKHPNETLIIVTADHETGGITFGQDQMGYKTNFLKLDQQKMSEEVFTKLLTDNKSNGVYQLVNTNFELKLPENFYKSTDPKSISNQVTDSLNRSAGIGWTTGSHTGSPVLTFAIGVGSEQFRGNIDNTDIIRFIQNATLLKKK